jgi:hypothetical protein
MKVCSYCTHEAHFIFVEEDYGEVDICGCCFGDEEPWVSYCVNRDEKK